MNKEDVKIYYPIKHKPREIQLEALDFTKKQIRHGKKYIMLNMPTGSGKSLFSIMFINWYLNYINSDAKFDILTNSKILQRQYTDEFSFISSLKGKNSYRCNDYTDMSCEDGKELNKSLKRVCNDCPYDKAMLGWKTNRVSITNFHLFDTLCLFKPDIIREKEPNVLIIDEAHGFDETLCSFISNIISKISLKKLGFTEISILNIFQDIKNINHIYNFVEYIENEFLNKLSELEDTIIKKLSNNNFQIKDKVKFTKNITAINAAKNSYKNFLDDYKINPNNWVLDFEQMEDKQFYKNFILEPVWSHKYLKEIIWDKYDHILFLSGTLLDKNVICNLNGIDVNESGYIGFDSPFPIKNRPIFYIKGIGKNNFTEKKNTFEKQKSFVDKIINKYKDKKGIIHSGNYEISQWLEEYYKDNKRFIFHNSENREDMIRLHMESSEPTILVSPSIISGIDFKDDLSRYQIILKIPYPNLGSKKIKKRLNEYKDWYTFKSVADLIQGLGRSIRSEVDTCDSFILDDCFSDVLRNGYKFIPYYISDAIKILK